MIDYTLTETDAQIIIMETIANIPADVVDSIVLNGDVCELAELAFMYQYGNQGIDDFDDEDRAPDAYNALGCLDYWANVLVNARYKQLKEAM